MHAARGGAGVPVEMPMPVYTYACECGEKFEKLMPMSRADDPQECPACDRTADRTIAGAYENNSTRNRSANLPRRKRYTNW